MSFRCTATIPLDNQNGIECHGPFSVMTEEGPRCAECFAEFGGTPVKDLGSLMSGVIQSLTTSGFAVLFLILAAVSGFAQTTQFVASTPNVDDPPYGLVAQLWNGSTSTIYIDHIDVTAAVQSTGGLLQFGIGYSRFEESQCTPAGMMVLDPFSGPTPSTDFSVRVSQQPCKPNGMTYGICLSQCGAPNAVYNYTPTNVDASGKPLSNLTTCWLTCTFDVPGGMAIPPNRGVTVYTAYIQPIGYLGWKGYAAVNFRGRK